MLTSQLPISKVRYGIIVLWFEARPYTKAIVCGCFIFIEGIFTKKYKALREFGKYIFLSIFAQIAFSCHTLVDTHSVSWKLKADGLSTLNIAFPMFCVINGMGLMIGIGGNIKYSIFKGKDRDDDANTISTNAVVLGINLTYLSVVSGMFFSDKLVKFSGMGDCIFKMANTCLGVVILLAPAFFMNNILQCFIRNDRNPRLSMAAMTIGSISNVILNYVFIFPMNMGVFGTISATGLAPIINMTVTFPHIISRNDGFHLDKNISDFHSTEEIVSKGMFTLLTETTSASIMFTFGMVVLGISGNVGVAAFSIITTVSLVVTAIYAGLSQGIQPLISHYYEENDAENVGKILRYAIVIQIMLSILTYGAIYFNTDILATFHNKANDVLLQDYAVSGIRIYFVACFFIGLNIVVSTCFMSTKGSIKSQVTSFARGFVIIISTVLILSKIFAMTSVWTAYPMSKSIACMMAIVLFFREKRVI